MTGDLVPAGQNVRVLPSVIGPVVPVVDIAEMIGYSRDAITKAIKTNESAFEGLKTFQTLPTSGGDQQFLCLTNIGIERLFLLISPSSKTKKDLFRRVEAFRAKAFGRMVSIPPKTDIKTDLKQAREYAEITSGDPRQFQAVVFREHGLPKYADALLQSVPALVHGETGWFNPSQLGERCCLNAREVNSYLYNQGYQYPQGPVWRLQPKGEVHAEEYWFEATSGHREIRIRWRESILLAAGLIRQPEILPAATAKAGS